MLKPFHEYMLKEKEVPPRACAFTCTRDGLKLTGICISFILSATHVQACKRAGSFASVQARARMRPYLQLEQLDREIDLLNERHLEVDL